MPPVTWCTRSRQASLREASSDAMFPLRATEFRQRGDAGGSSASPRAPRTSLNVAGDHEKVMEMRGKRGRQSGEGGRRGHQGGARNRQQEVRWVGHSECLPSSTSQEADSDGTFQGSIMSNSWLNNLEADEAEQGEVQEIVLVDDTDEEKELPEYDETNNNYEADDTDSENKQDNAMDSSVGRRWTRSCVRKQPRVSYSKYFKVHSDDDEEEEEIEEDERLQEDVLYDNTNETDVGYMESSPKVGTSVNDQEGIRHKGLHTGKSRKKKRDRATKYSVLKLLVDTIFNNTKKLPADLPPPKNEPCYEEPDFFCFGDEDPKPVVKSDYDRAIDELWAEFEFAMGSKNIGTYNADEYQVEETNAQHMEDDPSTICSKGKHCFILDEQIGIICKFCSFVSLEIRYILPSMETNMWKKSDWSSSNNESVKLHLNDLCDTFRNINGQVSNSPTGTVWDLIPGVYATMYDHQQEAFEFMWRNLAGGIQLDDLKSGLTSDVVGGCVISHAPGTGKTRLAIIFIQTYLKVFPGYRPMIIAPSGMLLTWENEAKKWDVNVPIHNLNSLEYTGKEDRATLALTANKPKTSKLMRLVKLASWDKGNSILGISYNLFKKLTADASTDISKILLEKPGLLVLDEGHIPRNDRSLIWNVLGKVKTEKRVILSGTPFQNNFGELYNILWLVRPKFAEKISTKTCRPQEILLDEAQDILAEKNGGKGIWTSLTDHVTDENVEEVRSILKPFVHIHNGSILKNLPGLKECLIVLDPLPHQKSIIEKIKHIGSNANFESEYKLCLASIHPSLVTCLNMSEEESSLVDKNMLEKLKLKPAEGAKTQFVVEVVRLCQALNEKVLVFSQYIQPLALTKEQLIHEFFEGKLIHEFNWIEGKEVLQMDGKILTKNRHSSIDMFNDAKSEARVLLASTKACCEGISLTGASRVILLDVVWNPAVGRQAISRAYRIGQKKSVYTYNLMTFGTGEREKYDKQARKDHLSKLLFSPEIDSTNVKNTFLQSGERHLPKTLSEDKVLEEIVERLQNIFVDIYYPPKQYCICS